MAKGRFRMAGRGMTGFLSPLKVIETLPGWILSIAIALLTVFVIGITHIPSGEKFFGLVVLIAVLLGLHKRELKVESQGIVILLLLILGVLMAFELLFAWILPTISGLSLGSMVGMIG